MPFLLFVFLCLLQILFIAHARVLLDYAAFNAARAGVVHNGNRAVMRNAALFSMLPAFGRVDTPKHALDTWTKVKAWALVGNLVDEGTHAVEGFLNGITDNKVSFTGMFPDVSVVSVEILNPSAADFKDVHGNSIEEIDLDLAARLDEGEVDPNAIRKTRLTIRVQWLYMMRVPLANQLLYRLFMIGSFMRGQLQKAQWQNWYDVRMKNGDEVDKAIKDADYAAFDLTKWPNGPAAIVRDQLMFQALKRLPDITDDLGAGRVYLMPLYAVMSMPMESNLYLRFVK